MQILAFFTNDGVPQPGLTPLVRIRDIADNSLVVSDLAASEVGDGWYKYNFVSYDSSKEYAIRFDGGASLVDTDRYTSGTNDSFVDDIVNGVWSEDLSIYNTGAGKMQQLQTFNGYVRIDTTAGYSGITFPIGTYEMPSNNLTDALTICTNNNIGRLRLRSDLIIEASHDISDKSLETRGIMGTDVILEAGCNANNTTFRYINLQGMVSNGDNLLVENCSVFNLENFTGIMQAVTFSQGSEISINNWAEIYNCRAGGEPGNEPEINIGTANLNIQQYRGNIKLTNKTGSNRTVVGCLPANVTIASSCVAGKIQILGLGEVEKDESGVGCQVDIDAALTNKYIADHVLDELVLEHQVVGSLGYILNEINNNLKRTLGLMHENIFIDTPIYDDGNNLISARVRIYSAASSVGTTNNIIGTYELTSDTDEIPGKFNNWKQIKV